MSPAPRKRLLCLAALLCLEVLLAGCASDPNLAAPGVTLSVSPEGGPEQVTSGVRLLVLLTVLSLAPAILMLATSFTRIVIVLSVLRSAIGTPTIPPNQVIIGLSLLLTFFIMAPVYNQIDQQAVQPYLSGAMDQETAIAAAIEPVREFMFKQTREKDIQLFLELNHQPQPDSLEDIDTVALFPAFVISELRTAFTMGFVLYIPFLIIDLVVSSILLSMGMMMLPPSLVSLPFKLLLFVMVDGWYLVVNSMVLSFAGG
ncbi:MAG TPA: flagellar type III secretion system pore protein FliP [Anaerolineaceae bacterium]|nr:flagellar type III secretion system pore protein FliP [Anaerolineaceae bacterium]